MKWVSKGRCYRQLKGTTDFSISALAPAQLARRTMISTLGYFLMELCMRCRLTAGRFDPASAGQEMVAGRPPAPAGCRPSAAERGRGGRATWRGARAQEERAEARAGSGEQKIIRPRFLTSDPCQSQLPLGLMQSLTFIYISF